MVRRGLRPGAVSVLCPLQLICPARIGSAYCSAVFRHRNSKRRIILCSWSGEASAEAERAWSNSVIQVANSALVHFDLRARSRMQEPRKSAMYCNSSEERPARKRRARERKGTSAHEMRAATRQLRTADLLSSDGAYERVLAVLCRNQITGARGRRAGTQVESCTRLRHPAEWC